LAFSLEFEEQLMARLVRDKKFFFNYQSVLSENHFESQIHLDIYSIVCEYHPKYSDNLSSEILKNEITSKLAFSRRKDGEETFRKRLEMYFEAVDMIYGADISSGEQYTVDTVVEFAKRQELKRILITAAGELETGGKVTSLSSDLAKLESIGSTMILGYDYFDEVVPRTSSLYEKRENVVGTGFPRLNRFLGGGLAGSELGVVVGPPSRGKTAMLVNLAVGALIGRKNVVYFVLEGGRDDVAIRFDMRLSRISKDQLLSRSGEVYEFVEYFSKKVAKSKLIIQMYPTETATVKDMDDFLTHKEMVDGFSPDVIIIDYLNLCKRSTKEDIWVGRSYREGKALATRRNKPVWSAVQAKMGSLKSDIITGKDIAEATGRIWADADVVIGECQSDEEEKKSPMEMRFYLAKNRNRAAKKTIPIIFDSDLMLMEERNVR